WRSEGTPFRRTKAVPLRWRRSAQPGGDRCAAGDADRNLAEPSLTPPCALRRAVARRGCPHHWDRRRRGRGVASFSQDSHWIGASLGGLFTMAQIGDGPLHCEECGVSLQNETSGLGCLNCLLLGGPNEPGPESRRFQDYEICCREDGVTL